MNHRRSFDFFNERLSTEDTLAAGLPQGHVPLGLVAGKLDRSRRRVTQTRWQPWASEREGHLSRDRRSTAIIEHRSRGGDSERDSCGIKRVRVTCPTEVALRGVGDGSCSTADAFRMTPLAAARSRSVETASGGRQREARSWPKGGAPRFARLYFDGSSACKKRRGSRHGKEANVMKSNPLGMDRAKLGIGPRLPA